LLIELGEVVFLFAFYFVLFFFAGGWLLWGCGVVGRWVCSVWDLGGKV
jgi:hypothetical protein